MTLSRTAKKHIETAVRVLKNAPFADSFTREKPSFPMVRIPRELKGRGPKRLVLHVGAHKTGTSSLQTMLRSTGDQLAAQGVFAFAHHVPRTPWSQVPHGRQGYDEELRPSLEVMLQATEGSTEFIRASQTLTSRIEAVAQDAPTILYSDEALMGRRLRNFGGLYPHAEKQLRAFKQGFPDRDLHVILYIRDHSKYIESCYLQSVKEGTASGSFADFLEKRVDLNHLSWLDLANRISSVVGPSALIVERFERIKLEGFVPFAKRFLSRFAQAEEIIFHDIRTNPSLSAEGTKAALAIRPHVSAKQWRRYKKLLAHDFHSGPDNPPPVLLSDAQRKTIAAMYAGDCEAAEMKYGGDSQLT